MTLPTPIPFFEELRKNGTSVSMIRCGPWHSMVLTSDGRLFSFGMSEGYRLGTGVDDDEDVVRSLDP